MSRYEKLADLKPSEKGNTDFEQVFAAATISEGSTNSSSEREPPLKGWEKVNVRSTSSTSTSTSTSSSASNSGVGDNTTTEQKPHKSTCLQWEAIRAIEKRDGNLCPSHFEVENQIGEGSIGTVFRAKLEDTGTYFAMKVMNRQILSKRGKLKAVKNELEILQLLDHPFLPTLYFYFEVNDYSVLVMEYCPGGDLYALQQRRHSNLSLSMYFEQ